MGPLQTRVSVLFFPFLHWYCFAMRPAYAPMCLSLRSVILASDFAPFGPLRLKPAHSNRELSCDSQQRNHVPHALSAPEMLWRMKSTLSRLFAQDEDEFRLFLTAADTDASVDQPARVELPFHLHNARLRLNRRMNDGSPVTILVGPMAQVV